MSDKTISQNAIVIERTFDAPIDVIWQLWTKPEHFVKWYGPKGFSVSVIEMDLRVGGRHLFRMESQTNSNRKMWLVGEYTEIVPNQRLVYTDSMSDEQGNVLPASALGMPDDQPVTTVVTVLLEAVEGRTKMRMTHAGVGTGSDGASEGWEQAFDKLEHAIGSVSYSGFQSE